MQSLDQFKPNQTFLAKDINKNIDQSTTKMEDLLLGRYLYPNTRPISIRFKTEIYPENFSNIKKRISRFDYSEPETTPSQLVIQQQQQPILLQQQTNNENNKTERRQLRKPKPRNKMRYMTQPITLIEIKESEEDLNAENK
jgi:hypothetical protein